MSKSSFYATGGPGTSDLALLDWYLAEVERIYNDILALQVDIGVSETAAEAWATAASGYSTSASGYADAAAASAVLAESWYTTLITTGIAGLDYTPAVLADWSGSLDPGYTNDALDQLALRLTDIEASVSSGTLPDGDKGDITVSASGATWTIDADVVTYAKMQNVSATSRVLGRKTAGAGDVEELTLSEVLDLVGSSATGDLLYKDTGGWTRLAKGSMGQVLGLVSASLGGTENPQWITQSSLESWGYACSDETTALTTGVKVTDRAPYQFRLSAVKASLTTAQTSGSIFTVIVKVGGTSIFSTNLTIDNTEKTSATAATAAVLTSTPLTIAANAEITIEISQIGDGTAKGLKVHLIGEYSA